MVKTGHKWHKSALIYTPHAPLVHPWLPLGLAHGSKSHEDPFGALWITLDPPPGLKGKISPLAVVGLT